MRLAVLLISLLVVLLVALGVAALRPQPQPVGRPGPRLTAVMRRTSRWRWGGVALGVLLAVGALASEAALGRGWMLAAPLFALAILVGVAVGELRVAAPTATSRSAALEVRRVRDYLPRGLVAGVVAATGSLGVVLLITTGLGSPDDFGRPGRWLVQQCSGALTQSRGPWPGSFYSLPLAAIVLAGLAASSFTLRQVVRRPRQGEDVVVDDTLRRHAVTAIVAASGILVAVPLAGVSVIGSIALLGISCPPWWMPVMGWLLLVLLPGAALLAIWCTVVLAVPPSVGTGHGVA